MATAFSLSLYLPPDFTSRKAINRVFLSNLALAKHHGFRRQDFPMFLNLSARGTGLVIGYMSEGPNGVNL